MRLVFLVALGLVLLTTVPAADALHARPQCMVDPVTKEVHCTWDHGGCVADPLECIGHGSLELRLAP